MHAVFLQINYNEMKYAKLAITIFIITLIIGFYLVIPSTIKVSTYKVAASYELTILRLINNHDLMSESLSEFKDSTGKTFKLNDIQFELNTALSNLIQIDITTDKLKTKSFVSVHPLNKESAAIYWFFEIKTSWNPIQRWKDYQEAKKIKAATAQLLNKLKTFVEKPKNIYGFDIKEVSLKDTLLLVTKFKSGQLPTNEEIYRGAEQLTKYLAQFGKKGVNNPMVTILDNQTYDYSVMVGISIDAIVPETDKFRLKRMPVNGKMFVANVNGGYATIQNGYSALRNYLLDSKRPSPAVPFELLINDRRLVSDSTKWETLIYYPVM